MQIILSQQLQTIAGTLAKHTGYLIRSRAFKNGTTIFFTKRDHRQKSIPPDGHWQFIRLCAEMAHRGNYIADIILPRTEFLDAFFEAYGFVPACTLPEILHANDIMNPVFNSHNL